MMGYILPEIPTRHLRIFFCHNPGTKMTRFKKLVKYYAVFSLNTFPTETKAAHRQKKTTQRPKKAKKPKEDEKPIVVFSLLIP